MYTRVYTLFLRVHPHLLKHKEKVVQTNFYNMKFNSFPRSRSGRSHATFPALTFLKAAKHDVIGKIMGEGYGYNWMDW